jgi:hypothetical protein
MGSSLAIFAALLETPPGEVFRFKHLWIGDHWLVLAGGFFNVGYQMLLMGVAAHKYTKSRGLRPPHFADRLIDRFGKVDAFLLTAVLLFVIGISIIGAVFVTWTDNNHGELQMTREMTIATTLIVASFQNLFGGFLISMLGCDE